MTGPMVLLPEPGADCGRRPLSPGETERHVAERAAMKMAWRLVVAGAVCALLAVTSSAAAGTRVVFTVDVESNERFGLPDQINAVCEDGSACGLMAIVRMLEARRWPGTFFLDVYEHRQWGEAAMRNIAVGLQYAGQDVALHTHPQWAYDPSRWAMHQYSVDEQTTIVRDGMRLLERWTGLPVVAHRAGAYAADERTLIALQRNGVLIDSSSLLAAPHQPVSDALGLPRNWPRQARGRRRDSRHRVSAGRAAEKSRPRGRPGDGGPENRSQLVH